ncbi:MAG: methionyl-tRNA formyltransferase, partial [Alphaproteobacteria bacterium]
LRVAGGEGARRARGVQRAGRAAMDAADFLRGRAVPTGTRLS